MSVIAFVSEPGTEKSGAAGPTSESRALLAKTYLDTANFLKAAAAHIAREARFVSTGAEGFVNIDDEAVREAIRGLYARAWALLNMRATLMAPPLALPGVIIGRKTNVGNPAAAGIRDASKSKGKAK
jgi:hypothetical protein